MGSQHEVTLFLVWILVCLPHITLRLRIFPPTLLTSSCLYLSPQIFSFSRLIGRDSDAGKDWRQKEKGAAEEEMVGWHHWLNGYEFEQTQETEWRTEKPGVLQSMGSKRVGHDWVSELNRTEVTLNSWNVQGIRHEFCTCKWLVCVPSGQLPWEIMESQGQPLGTQGKASERAWLGGL